MACTACKKYDHTLLRNIYWPLSFENSFVMEPHSNGVRISCHHTLAPEDLRHVNTVHDRCQHSDLIRLGPIDCIALAASPEVSAADHDTYFDPVIDRRLNLSAPLP